MKSLKKRKFKIEFDYNDLLGTIQAMSWMISTMETYIDGNDLNEEGKEPLARMIKLNEKLSKHLESISEHIFFNKQ